VRFVDTEGWAMSDSMDRHGPGARGPSRRALLGLLGGTGIAVSLAAPDHFDAPAAIPTARHRPLNTGWLFGGEYRPGMESAA
jgi:hypothetical protein